VVTLGGFRDYSRTKEPCPDHAVPGLRRARTTPCQVNLAGFRERFLEEFRTCSAFRAVIHPVNIRPASPLASEASPAWLLPVVVCLTALAFLGVVGLRSTQRQMERDAQWQVPPAQAHCPSGPAHSDPSLILSLGCQANLPQPRRNS